MIKRLLLQRLPKKCEDPDDKRSVSVAITDIGRNEIAAILPDRCLASKVIDENLNN